MSETYSFKKTIRVLEVTSKPVFYKCKANQDDLMALKERLGILGIDSFQAAASVKTVKNSQGIEIKGEIKSKITQKCVATDEQVKEVVDGHFSLQLLPQGEVEALDSEEAYMDPEAPEYDLLEGDEVELGEVLVQTLAVMMNPYPRAEGVEIETSHLKGVTVDEGLLEKPNPFDALKKLHDKT